MVFDLINNGTENAFPIVKVKHNAENGYIGLVNQNGTLEIGNREEADTEPSQNQKSYLILEVKKSQMDWLSQQRTKPSQMTGQSILSGQLR